MKVATGECEDTSVGEGEGTGEGEGEGGRRRGPSIRLMKLPLSWAKVHPRQLLFSLRLNLVTQGRTL